MIRSNLQSLQQKTQTIFKLDSSSTNSLAQDNLLELEPKTQTWNLCNHWTGTCESQTVQ